MKIKLNPDKEMVKTVREGLKRTGGYCPCMLVRRTPSVCVRRFESKRSRGFAIVGCIIKQRRMTKMAVMTVTKENFQEEVMQAGCPVLLDFWATWCGPCRMVSPIVDEIGAEVTDAKVGKVNVDEQPDLAAQFGVMSIPTLLVFEQGKLVRQAVGARPKAGVLELLG